MTDDILEMVEDLLKSAMKSFDKMANDACDVLSGGIDSTLWNTVVGSSNVFSIFCNIIIGICILLELAQIASKVDLIKWEHGLKCGVKLCIAKVCIDVAPTFLKACYNQCNLFIAGLGASASVNLSGAILPEINSALLGIDTLGGAIGLLASSLILIIGIKICGLLVMVMAYGRVFEILIYLLVSPLPISFACYTGGGDGIARITTKFFKGFIAVCLSGVMMYMSISLFGTIVSTSFRDFVDRTLASGVSGGALVSDLCYDMILFTIVLVMAIAKSGGWAKQIMDA